MSDDFLRVATREINDDLEGMQDILSKCHSDGDILKVVPELEKRMHRIKGLAPMMGKKDIGELSSLIDAILKKILLGESIGSLKFLKDSCDVMMNSMNDSNMDCKKFYNQMKDKYSDYID